MEITQIGPGAFHLKGESLLAINPPQQPGRSCVSLYSARKNRTKQIVDGPGEYEIRGMLIVTVETGEAKEKTLAHSVTLGDLNIVHLGTRLNTLGNQAVEALGKVDVLLLPAEDVTAAQQAVSLLEPRVVIPFGTRAADLLHALGIQDAKPENRFNWNGQARAPRAVLLKQAGTRRKAA